MLAAEPDLAAQVQAHGKSHADAILIGVQEDRSVLEPVDFKWTLETANPRQVGAEVLGELLLEAPPLLATRLAEALADLPSPEAPIYHDGIFLAPDHAENRAQLAPHGPLDPDWAVLCPIDAAEFFPPLPGWDVALALARSDGAYLGTVEASERYYRLGAGVLGALRRMQSSVFDDALPTVDGPALLAKTRRERRLNTTGEVIAYFDRALIARSEVVDRLREIERGAYPYGRYREDLTARGLTTAGNNDRRWSRLYGSVMKELASEIRAEGRRLRDGGAGEAAVLAELDGQRAKWLARGRTLLDQRLASRPAPTSDPPPTPLLRGEGSRILAPPLRAGGGWGEVLPSDLHPPPPLEQHLVVVPDPHQQHVRARLHVREVQRQVVRRPVRHLPLVQEDLHPRHRELRRHEDVGRPGPGPAGASTVQARGVAVRNAP